MFLGHLAARLNDGTLKPIYSQQSGLVAVRECMREMSGGHHIGKIIVCAPSEPPTNDINAAVIITGGTGAIGGDVAGWAHQQ